MAVKRRRRVAAVLVPVLLAAGVALAADFLASYKEGLAAAEKGDWQAVAQSMRAALDGRSEDSVRLTKGFYFKRYIPHYYLGRALFELGDCEGALAAWDEATKQGVIQRFSDEYADQQVKAATCRKRLAGAARDLDQARQMAAAAGRTLEKVAELSDRPEVKAFWRQGSPSPADRMAEARADLEKTRGALPDDDASIPPEQVATALDLARRTAETATALEKEVEDRLAAGRQAADEARSALGDLASRVREILAAAEALTPLPATLGRRKTALEAALQAAQQVPAGAPVATVERARKRLSEAFDGFRRAVAPPPEAIADAARAYFSGSYDKVVTLLSGAAFSDPRAQAQALLFRAAARYALYLTGGQRDSDLLAAARRDVAACRAADGGLTPAPTAFTPRFVDFFNGAARR